MARHLMQGDPLYILFDVEGASVFDSQNRPRMYKSVEAFQRAFPRGIDGVHLEKYIPSQTWISVNDRLPEDDSYYLVWVSDACTVERAMYYGDGEWLTEEFDNLTRFVTHWMPLPLPPEGE